jgi:hypothetical protein
MDRPGAFAEIGFPLRYQQIGFHTQKFRLPEMHLCVKAVRGAGSHRLPKVIVWVLAGASFSRFSWKANLGGWFQIPLMQSEAACEPRWNPTLRNAWQIDIGNARG